MYQVSFLQPPLVFEPGDFQKSNILNAIFGRFSNFQEATFSKFPRSKSNKGGVLKWGGFSQELPVIVSELIHFLENSEPKKLKIFTIFF